ncbi:MAG: acetyl-CoA synthase subunit delta, partial [Candidatus Altarchaeaceae archaeon]
ARETFLKNELWGPRELRGPLWEVLTTTIALLSGTNIFLMLHPVAIASLQNLIDEIYEGKKQYDYMNWITKKISV